MPQPMYEGGFLVHEMAQGRQKLACLPAQPSSWGCQVQC